MLKPEDWDPEKPLGPGQRDLDAIEIGLEIARGLPKTLDDAIVLYGPLEITHIQFDEPAEGGWWKPMYFLSALRKKPDVFFVALGYKSPYFRKWVERVWVKEGIWRALPKPFEFLPQHDICPWLTSEGDIMIADGTDPFHVNPAQNFKVATLGELFHDIPRETAV